MASIENIRRGIRSDFRLRIRMISDPGVYECVLGDQVDRDASIDGAVDLDGIRNLHEKIARRQAIDEGFPIENTGGQIGRAAVARRRWSI